MSLVSTSGRPVVSEQHQRDRFSAAHRIDSKKMCEREERGETIHVRSLQWPTVPLPLTSGNVVEQMENDHTNSIDSECIWRPHRIMYCYYLFWAAS